MLPVDANLLVTERDSFGLRVRWWPIQHAKLRPKLSMALIDAITVQRRWI